MTNAKRIRRIRRWARRLFAAELEWLCKRAEYADTVDAAAVRDAVLRDILSDTRSTTDHSGPL